MRLAKYVANLRWTNLFVIGRYVETFNQSKHQNNMRGLPKTCHTYRDRSICDMLIPTINPNIKKIYMWLAQQVVKLFEMDGDVKSTRHRSISQDRGYNFNLIWVWFTGLHTPSFLLHMIIINIKKYWSWLENLQRVPMRHPKRSKAFILCGGDGLFTSSCVNLSLYLLYLSQNFFLIVGSFLHLCW